MQSKVSMVMACYNKEAYIADMFDSILAQKWNNIELILVNDGSTDGTRDIIGEYEPKFIERGYKAVVIDQDNAGVCAAVKSGFEVITGNYVCCVDADDLLDLEYVSAQVSFLENNQDYDYTMCNYSVYNVSGSSEFVHVPREPFEKVDELTAEQFFFINGNNLPWSYMARRSYFDKCGIIKAYGLTARIDSHEVPLILPLRSFGGKLKHIEKDLYFFNQIQDQSRHSLFSEAQGFYIRNDRYYGVIAPAVIDSFSDEIKNQDQKSHLKMLAKFGNLLFNYNYALGYKDEKKIDEIICEVMELINEKLNPVIEINPEIFNCDNRERKIGIFAALLFSLKKRFLLGQQIDPKSGNGRIVFYGVLGKRYETWRANYAMPYVFNLVSELWDQNGDGIKVKKPDFDRLKQNDIMFIFPSNSSVIAEIKKQAKNCSNIYSGSDIYLLCHDWVFIFDYILGIPRCIKSNEDR